MQRINGAQYKRKGLSDSKFVDNTVFTACIFEGCDLSDYRFTNCAFEDCIFTKCNFKKAFMAINKGYSGGKFLRCVFIDCNFKAASFGFPEIDHCEFRNCELRETSFDGSRFSHTSFTGELDSCFFYGHAIYYTKPLFSFSTFDVSKYPNEMIQVDFSQATLIGNFFSHGIDLRNCIFPQGEDYLFVPDLRRTMTKAIEFIRTNWPAGREKEVALGLIDMVYFTKDMQSQPNGFYDALLARESDQEDGTNLMMRVFTIVKSFT